ncbi:unnamed protein product [Rotaria magnacalcarata]
MLAASPNTYIMNGTSHFDDQSIVSQEDWDWRAIMETRNDQLFTPLATVDSVENGFSNTTDISASLYDVLNSTDTRKKDMNTDIFQGSDVTGNINYIQDQINQCLEDLQDEQVIPSTDVLDEFSVQLPIISDQVFNLDCLIQEKYGPSSLKASSFISKTGTNSTITTTTQNPCQHDNIVNVVNHHDLSNVGLDDLDAFEIAKQQKFNLTVPTKDEELKKTFRLNKKSFAAVCHSNMTKENIMKHIQNEFDELIQYICVSSQDESQAPYTLVYIQIILQKTINKKTYFLKAVAGMQCNYEVTYNDRAWNTYLKKVGNHIEFGSFQSVKSRTGTKWSEAIRQKHKSTIKKSKKNHIQLQNTKSQLIAKQVADDIMAKVKASIKEAIDVTDSQMPIECPHERET